MSETARVFLHGAAAIRAWAVNCARAGRPHSVGQKLAQPKPHNIELLEARIEMLEKTLEFYASEENWSTMGLAEYRTKYGIEPKSEMKVGRMRLVALGRALPAVLHDVGERAKKSLDACAGPEAPPENG